jgi:hypothetical protein
MAIDITALYCCLDDFCKVFEDWEAHRLIPSQTTRQRAGKLSRAEMLFVVVLFHLSPYKHFKAFYLYGIGQQYRACFGALPHYDRWAYQESCVRGHSEARFGLGETHDHTERTD